MLTDDFNCILELEDIVGGGVPDHLAIVDFKICVENMLLQDMVGNGCEFTWYKGSTLRRVDMILVNESCGEVIGNVIYVIKEKMASTKKTSKEFNVKHFNKLSMKVKEKEGELCEIQ
ncbi:hypothetical protein LIER_35603 [Lithospermum erythrorhizon]|uniref:Uncharacterized protein n=1 Tax=Lithospermum erythrorhizon TaxID=34254 RepID=A0AAV3NTA4_LITER